MQQQNWARVGTANWIPESQHQIEPTISPLATPLTAPAGEGQLLLRFERPRAIGAVCAALRCAEFSLQRAGEVLSVRVQDSEMPKLVATLAGALTPGEQGAIRVIWEAVGKALLRDCFDVPSLREWLARAQSAWFFDMMRDDRFEAHFQPIVSVETPGAVYGYESLLRGVTGEGLMAPLPLFEVAGGLKMRGQLDSRARQTAISEAARAGLNSRLFLNCLPSALDDPQEALRAITQTVDEAGLRREQIVLEIVESECVEDANALRAGLELFRRAGVGVALDDLGAGYASLHLLERLRPDFVKLDRELISGVDGDAFKAVIAEKLLETARGLGIVTVAEGVETEGEWRWLRAHGGELAQGYFFARPAAAPPLPAQWMSVGRWN